MGRIRTIKPEFWSHEVLSSLPEATHILAAALLNYADDEGYFNANVGLIKANCSPLREPSVSIHDSLTHLSNVGYLRFGVAPDRRSYGMIVSFLEHQRINRPTPSKIRNFGIIWEKSVSNHAQLSEDSPPEGKGTGNREEGTGNDIRAREERVTRNVTETLPERREESRASVESSTSPRESEPSQEPNGDVPEPEAKLEEPVLSGPVPDEGKSSLATERKRDLAESAPSYAISGNAPRLPARVADDDWPEDADPRDVAMRTLLAAHPRPVFGHHATMVAIEQVKALAAERGKGEYEAYEFLLGRTKAYKTATDGWQPSQKNFIVSAVNFFNDEVYRQDDDIWKRNDHDGAGDGGGLLERLAKGPRGLGTDVSTLPRPGSPEYERIKKAARTGGLGTRPGFAGNRLH
jgi:hypothetical protein